MQEVDIRIIQGTHPYLLGLEIMGLMFQDKTEIRNRSGATRT